MSFSNETTPVWNSKRCVVHRATSEMADTTSGTATASLLSTLSFSLASKILALVLVIRGGLSSKKLWKYFMKILFKVLFKILIWKPNLLLANMTSHSQMSLLHWFFLLLLVLVKKSQKSPLLAALSHLYSSLVASQPPSADQASGFSAWAHFRQSLYSLQSASSSSTGWPWVVAVMKREPSSVFGQWQPKFNVYCGSSDWKQNYYVKWPTGLLILIRLTVFLKVVFASTWIEILNNCDQIAKISFFWHLASVSRNFDSVYCSNNGWKFHFTLVESCFLTNWVQLLLWEKWWSESDQFQFYASSRAQSRRAAREAEPSFQWQNFYFRLLMPVQGIWMQWSPQ